MPICWEKVLVTRLLKQLNFPTSAQEVIPFRINKKNLNFNIFKVILLDASICEMVVKGAYVCSVSESYYSYKPNMKRYHVTFSMCHCESVTQKKMLRPRVHEWHYFNTTTSILINQVKIDVHRYSRSMKAKICLRTNYGNRTIKMVWTFTLTTHQKH